MLNHTLGSDDDADSAHGLHLSSISHLPRSESPTHMGFEDEEEEEDASDFLGKGAEGDDEKTMYGSANASRFSTMNAAKAAAASRGSTIRRRFGRGGADVEASPTPAGMRFSGMEEDTRAQKNARNRRLVKELKRGDRVNVKIQPMCLFLFKDGTVISIHKGACAVRAAAGAAGS